VYSFGLKSKANLLSCHPDLQRLLYEAIKYVDFSVTCGHRSMQDQQDAYNSGKSEVEWPNSKHNSYPSMAVDVAPYPIDWEDEESFTLLAGIIYGISTQMGIDIRLGADWDGDLKISEHKFKDRPHIELVAKG